MLKVTSVLGILVGAAAAQGAITTFDNGLEGWSISGRETIDAAGGNPGANLHGNLIDVFGADIRNETNADWLGDLTRYGAFEVSVDIQVNSIAFFNGEVPRDLIVEFRDNTNTNGYPYTSVWLNIGLLRSAEIGGNGEWNTYSATILDPFSTDLPGGWGGYGDEDPNTFEPILPADRTFTSVLQSVDSVHFTTFVPGFFYGFTNFDIQVDNLTIRSVPAPGSAALLGVAGLATARRRRR